MKFKKPDNYKKWTTDQTTERINATRKDIADLNREINSINSRIAELMDRKNIVKRKVSNKHKYINQLTQQIKEDNIKIKSASSLFDNPKTFHYKLF